MLSIITYFNLQKVIIENHQKVTHQTIDKVISYDIFGLIFIIKSTLSKLGT